MKTLYWENKTVLVTGGLGFIGSHFVEELLESGANVICLYRSANHDISFLPSSSSLRLVQVDLLDRTELMAVCRYVAPKIDTLFHCAALDGNTEFKLKNAARILDSNLRMTSNVLGCAHETGINNLALLSSAEIYAPEAMSPIKEEDDYKKQLGYSENGYILSKIYAEVLAQLHIKQYGMKIFLPRPTNVYGPRDNFNEATSRVIPSMIQKIALGEPIEIWGDGKQTRSFIHVKDLVRSVLLAIENKTESIINIATREEISILNLAQLIAKTYGTESKIHVDLSKSVGVQSRELDVSRLFSYIDFTPISLNDGIKGVIKWYKDNLA